MSLNGNNDGAHLAQWLILPFSEPVPGRPSFFFVFVRKACLLAIFFFPSALSASTSSSSCFPPATQAPCVQPLLLPRCSL